MKNDVCKKYAYLLEMKDLVGVLLAMNLATQLRNDHSMDSAQQ
jgi:hypothetical protein